MEKSQREKLQRFSIRKLSIGAVSCLIGTVTFLGYSHDVQAAEKPQTVETTKAENAIQSEKAQESKPTEEAKGDTQNVAADNNAVESQKAVDNNVGGSQQTDALTAVNQAKSKDKTPLTDSAERPKDKTPLTDSAERESNAAITTPVKQDTTTPSNHDVANQKSNVPEQVHLKLQQKTGAAANQTVLSVKNKAPLANLAENKVASDTGVTTPTQQDGAANEKLIGTGKKASVSLSDGSTLTTSNDILDDQNISSILTFQSGNFKAGDTYQIKVPKKGHLRLDKVDVASLPQGMGTTTFDDNDENYWVITDNFTSAGTVKQDIKINRYTDGNYLEYNMRNIYHNSIQLSKDSEEKANLNIDEIDDTYNSDVRVLGPYDYHGALLLNNDENKIASYEVKVTREDGYQPLESSNNEIHISSTIKNLDWAIPDKVLVNGEESIFTYDSNNKELIVPINHSNGNLKFQIDVIGRVNVDPSKFDSHHKWNTENAVGVQAKINNIEVNNSDTIHNIVMDSVQNLTVGDMFQIYRYYIAGYYDNKYPTPIHERTYWVNDDYHNDWTVIDAQDAINQAQIIDINNITGKKIDNVSVDADIPDGINLTNVALTSNTNFDEQEKVGIKTIISYTDGSSDIFNTSKAGFSNNVLNPNNNKKIKHIKLEVNTLNPGAELIFQSPNASYLSSVQKGNTKIAEKYADGTPVAPGDLITFKETISAYGQKATVDEGYLRLIDHNHDKYDLGLDLYSYQSNKSPNIQDAGKVVYSIHGLKKGDSPVVYVRVPNNATLTGDKLLFRAANVTDDNTPINYQLLHVGDSVFMKVQLPKNTSGSATVTVHYGTIPDGQTSEDQLAYAVSGIDTDSYIHKFDDMNHVTFADFYDGHVIYKNPEISNDFNALFKREGINLKDVAYYVSGYINDRGKLELVINNSTWDVLTSEGISTISMTDSNMNPMPNMDSTQDVHGEHPDTFNIYGSIINATDQTIKGATQVINVPDSSDGKSQFNPVLNGPIHLIDAVTGNDLSGLAEITYSTQKSDLNDPESTISGVLADQVTNWSQIKSVQVHFKNNSLPGKTSARAVLTLKDPHIYDDIGKTIYASNKAFTKDQQTGEFELLPTVIKSGSTNSAKLTVTGQAKVHTLIHYGDQYIELPDQLKTYAELKDVMQRNDFLSSDAGLTDQDRALLPANIAIDYAHPTIKNSDETYVDGYANGLAEFGKQAKYDFNNDSVVFNAQDMKLVTDNKDVTETIHYVYKDGPKKGQKAAEDAVNTVTFTKTGYQNPFTSETKWANNTETKEFKVVVSPTITNYTPDSKKIDAITVKQNSDNIVKTVSYKANRSNLHVIYQDDTDHQELSHQDFLNGIIGDSANYNTNDTISNYQNQHYDLVSDETNGQNLTYQDTDKTYVVHFKHHISNVNETSKSTQTVHYVASDNSAVPSDAKHEVSYSRTNQHDDVTDKITNYGTWGPIKTLPDVQTPEKKGYTPDIKEVQGATTTPGKSEDFKTIVTYTPDKQKAKVVFIDDTDHQTLKTVNKDGVTKGDSGYSTRQDIQNYENQHYVLVSDTSGGSELIFDDDDLTDQYYEVHLKHKTESVTRNDTVTRTIHYLYDNGDTAQPDKTQTVSFDETGIKDDVTNKTTWSNDNAQTVDSVITPSIIGYTPDKSSIEKQSFKFGDQDVEVTVTYNANAQTATITYIDDTTKNNLDSKDASGKFGQVIAFATSPTDEIANYKKQGYVLVSNSFDNNKYQADNSNNVFEVHLKHGTKKVSRNDDVNMTVHYVMDDGSTAPNDSKQTVNFTEDGIQDLVTQKITWTPADSQTLNDVVSPVLTGYTVDIKTVNGKAVNFGDPDINVTVTYHANAQTAKITYIDDTTKNTLDSKDASGKFGQAITFATAPSDEIANYKKQGYVLVSNSFDNNKYQADNNNNVFYVHLKHDTKKVSRNDDVNMTVHYVMDDDSVAPSDNKQTVNFTEDGIQDLVTQKITWTPDDSQTLNDVVSPVLIGYTADIKTAKGKVVNFGDPDINVTVHYSANAQTAKITYIDDTTKNTLDSKDANGKFGQTITFATAPSDEIANYKKQGYVLVSNSFNNQTYAADNNNNVFYVHLKHKTESVTRNDTVTRTIHYLYDNGNTAQPDKTQTVSFDETGTKDDVTNKTTWSNDNAQTVDSVITPSIIGYTPDKSSIEGQSFKFGDKDVEVTVRYSANEQTATITYIDDTDKKTLGSDSQNGKFNQAITFEHDPAAEIANYKKQGYVLVSNSFNNNKYQADDNNNVFYVHLKHGTKTVSRNDDVNMTVHYVMDDNSEAPSDNKQTVNFTEDGIQDLVTKHIDWTPADSQTLNDVVSPVLTGYTADIKTAKGKVVNFGDNDINVTVHYSANAQTATITYIDDTDKKTLGSDSQNGKFNQAITFTTSPTDEIANYKKQGYVLVSNSFDNNKYQADDNNNVFYVHLKHGTKNVSRNDDVTMTVHYVMNDNSKAPSDNKQTVNFTEDGIQDLVTQKITWTPADSQTLNDVVSPVLTGYTADIKTANGKAVNFGDPDINVTVTYHANAQTAKITYIDDTTKTNLDSKDASGKFGQAIAFATAPSDEIANYKKQGYVLVSNSFNNQTYAADNNNNVFYVHLKHNIENVTRNDTVTRTIHYLYDNGDTAQPDKTQTVSFNETGTKDDVTNKTTWSNDNAQSVDSVNTPSIIGYTPDKSSIEKQSFKFGDKDVEVTVTYHANTQTAKITYIDDTTKNNLDSKDASGKFGQTITFATAPSDEIANYKKQGYVLVSNSFDNNKYQADNSNNVFEVHLKHGTKKVSRNDDVNMTVHYVMDDNSKAPSDNKQTVNFTEDGIQDLVTQKITWTPAESQTLKDVDSPVLTGYTADIKTAKGKVVNFGDQDINVTVTYHANAQTAKITYIDDTTKNNLDSKDANGKFGQAITFATAPSDEIASYKKQGYKLVSNDFNDNKYQADNSKNVFYVHFVHDTKKVSRNDDVNMTVHYVMDDDSVAPSDSKQTVNFTEDGIQDLVTQKITWTPADSQKFDDVNSPVLTGYTADIKTVNGKVVNFGDNDINVTVTYHANAQTATITYIDDTTKTNLDSKDAKGKFGQAITFETAPSDEIANYKKQGYVLVSNSFNNQTYAADNNNNVFEVHLKHGTKNVSRNDDVNMTVHYVMDDNSKAPSDSKQTVNFTEDGIQDLVTQKTTWTPADSQKFDDVNSPVLTGYTADIKTVNGKAVNFGDSDINVTVTYHANAQTAKITYIDDTTKNTLDSKDASGKFGQAITFATAPTDEIANYKKQGYVLVSNSFDNNKYQADNNNNVFYVHFIHGTKKVSREHSASFTVHYIYQDGGQAKPDHEQTLSFTENGSQDLVTQKITWTPADSQKFDDAITPVITGYTPDHDKVIGQTANFETDNREVTVTYLPDVQLGHINYIDDNTGKTLTHDDFSGRTNEHEDYTPNDRIQEFENKGYVFVSSDYPDGGFNFDDNDQQEQVFNVHLKHGIVTVTSKKPQIPNMPIDPDPHSPKYPKDISNTNSDVKRTIDYKFKDGKTAQPTVNDSLHFERTVVIDKVTGDVLSDTWTPSQDFNDVQTPVIQGYTPDRTVVSDKNIGHDHQNIVEHVIYSPDAQHMTITYVDDTTHETLKQDKLDGTSDQDAKYTTSNNINHYTDLHYKLVSDSTNGQDLIFDHDDNADQIYEVHFVHGSHTINQTTSPKQTVHYVYADDLARHGKAADDNVQQLSFKRDGYNDEVTGIDHWNAWTSANSQYKAVDSPVIKGYTPDKSVIEKSTVNPTDKDTEITVVYSPDAQHMTITYVDDTTHETLKQDKLDGTSDQDAKYTTSNNISHYTDLHYKLVSDSTNGQDLIFDHDDNADQTYEVHFVHGSHTINQTTSPKQTVHYVYADDLARHGKAADDNVQQLSFKRDGYNDEVTGIDHWNAWTPANSNYSVVDSPVIQGYTPDKSAVEESTVNPTDQDTEITVVYNADKQAAHVIYVDKTTNTTLISDDLSGQSDKDSGYNTKDTIGKYQSQHYVLTGDETDGKNVIFDHDDKQNQTYHVYFVHGTQKVNRQDTVTSTIDYKFEDGKTAQPTVTQTKHFSEDGVKDLVTGKIAWDEAESQKFDDIATKSITGYTPDKDNVTGSTVNFGDSDIKVTVTYHNNAQKAVITYVDDITKKTLASDSQNGKFDHEITFEHDPAEVINSLKEKGYKLVSNDFKDGTKYKADDKQNEFIVHLTHDKQKVNRQDQVIETINYKFEDGKTAQPTVTQTKHFTEDGVKDLVTGKITWTPAKSQKFDDIATKSIVGYTPDKDNVTGNTVNFGDSDIEVTVTYHNNAQKAVITYIDDTAKKTLASDSQDGKFGHEITFEHDPAEVINGLEEKGYKLVSNDFNNNNYQADNSKNVFYVHFVHGSHDISDKKAITETITYKMSDNSKAPDKVEKQVEFSRVGKHDEVTNTDTWNKWQPNKQSFNAVSTPEVKGYTPDIKLVEAKTVTAGDKDIAVTVTYTPDQQKAKVLFIDDTTKNTLDTHNLTGVTNDHEKYSPSEEINQFVDEHYVFVSSDYPDNGFTYDNDDSKDQVFEIHLKHGSHAISDKSAITETITYKMSDSSKAPDQVEKQVEFSRDGYNDEVTKQDHWNKWQPNKQSFDAVPTPDVTGYTPDIKSVEAKTVTAGDKDITVTITYSPDQQKAKVVFIDDTTKKTLDTHNLTGVTNGHEKYSPSEEIEKFIHENYVFVSSDYPEKGFTYDNDDSKDQVFEIHFKERPTESDTPTIPDNTEDNGGSNDTSTDSDHPEKDNGGSDTVDKSSHKTSVKRNDNKKHHGTKKTNIQKNANKNHQGTKKTNIQKTSKTAKINSNRSAQPTLEKVQKSTNRANRSELKHDALPQTGEKHNSLMAMLGLAISGLGMIGAMKSKKRKDD